MIATHWSIFHARPNEYVAAAQLALGDASQVRAADLLSSGQIDPRGLFVTRDERGLRASLLCQAGAGAAANFWPPRGEADDFDALVNAAVAWLKSRNVKLAESIVRTGDADGLAPLIRAGFRAVGPMHFLRHDLRHIGRDPSASGMELCPYPDADAAMFADVLAQTYDGTLDFPELTGVRGIAEVMAGYLANPMARPERWWLVTQHDDPVAILMLTEVEPLEAWDLTYLGVLPNHRRRGIAKRLLGTAMNIARAACAERLDVAVDARNLPAIQLYETSGFQLVDRRLVSLLILDSHADFSRAP